MIRCSAFELLPPGFLLWLAVVYGAWVLHMFSADLWADTIAHWPIAVAMALGSYVAGSTPMGGGTVGFPMLVLIFDQPAANGRDFSFAIQAVGMTSATIYILLRKIPVAWSILRPAALGALLTTPLAVIFLAPNVDDLTVKLVFSTIWAAFGIAQLGFMKHILESNTRQDSQCQRDLVSGFIAGCVGGGLVASITGVGIDMILFVTLVLLIRIDARVAIPTSVLLMTFTSLIGLGTSVLHSGIPQDVWSNWHAAVPVVAVGAPLGALAASLLPKGLLLRIVSILCLLQFVGFCLAERLTGVPLALTLAALGLVTIAFAVLHKWGGKRQMNR